MKKRTQLFLSMFMAIIMLVQVGNTSFFVAHALDSAPQSTAEKVDSNLFSEADTKDDKYLVCLWFDPIAETTISAKLKETTGYDSLIYENEALYEKHIVANITQKTIETYGYNEAFAISSEMASKGESITRVEEALSNDYNEYVLAKRQVTSELYQSQNRTFVNKYINSPTDIVYTGSFTGTIILYASKAEIAKYASIGSVKQISPFVDEVQTPDLFVVQDQLGTDGDTGTKSTAYNYGSGFRGTNVKIGILEAGSGRYNASATQLASIPSTQLQYVANRRADGTYITPTVTTHATMVTTLIVGQSVTVNGREYEGVVPNATVYQMPVVYGSDVINGISQLAELGVTVINYSGGSGNTLDYPSYDREVDNIIKSTGISFIVSAGNEGNNDPADDPDDPQYPCITSPGKAYNAITVGNLRTKSGTYASVTTTYSMSSSSSYAENSNIANKPDVVAPGSYIAYVSSGTTVSSSSGTSCAAPLITGVVAQLHQYRNSIKVNPTLTKAMLLIGASNDKISTTNNETVDNAYFRDRSGAGLVSATKSQIVARQYSESSYSINLNTITSSPVYTKNISLDAGETIRIVLTFDKPEDGYIASDGYENDVDIWLCSTETDETVAYSASWSNNVEIIEYTAIEDGDFYIEVDVYGYIAASSTTYLKVSMVWNIE